MAVERVVGSDGGGDGGGGDDGGGEGHGHLADLPMVVLERERDVLPPASVRHHGDEVRAALWTARVHVGHPAALAHFEALTVASKAHVWVPHARVACLKSLVRKVPRSAEGHR